ncbi:MAG: PorT family protein [Treponemataceae bacterium]|nr:PorT family protein [Treponemataceae bacterium]
MKKILVAVLAAAVAAASVSAEGRFVVGAKGMFQLNAGTVVADDFDFDDVSQKVLPGGGGGIFARVNVFKGLGIQLEALFTGNNGVKQEWEIDGAVATQSVSYTALDIPLLVTWDFNLGPVILTPFLGPNFSIPLGDAKVKSEYDGKSFDSDISVSSHFIPGIAFGLAAGFPVGPGAIVTEVRYLHDFTPLSVSADGEDGDYDVDVATRGAFGISIGWQFMF